MKPAESVTKERFLARALLADERAAGADEESEKKMWEDIARVWRSLAQQCPPEAFAYRFRPSFKTS